MALLIDIGAFLERHQLSQSAFGERAIGDKNLIPDLRAGRELLPRTERRVRAFMASYEAQAAA